MTSEESLRDIVIDTIKDGKWYGWSHRAMYGFKIGDIVKEGDCCAASGWTNEYLKDHPDENVLPVGFEAKTEEDCKRRLLLCSKWKGAKDDNNNSA